MFRVERHSMSGSRTGSSLTIICERRMWTQLRLAEECRRLQKLYAKFPRGSEQRLLIKRQIRAVAGHSGSVETSAMIHRSRGGTGHGGG